MKIKKIPKKFALWILTVGASLIVGLLSFSGMLALWPILALAGVSFGLAVAFEGEVYFQNIKHALKKLLKPEYHARQLAKEYLCTHFPKTTPRPEFFRDYQEKLQRHHTLKHKACNEKETFEKLQLEQELDDLEKWFALQLFAINGPDQDSSYQKELHAWLALHDQSEWQTRLKTQRTYFKQTAVLSVLAGVLMCFGSSYLLLEAFAVIPFAALVISTNVLLPLALIAGTAYGLLTYNAFTDMISNNTLLYWRDRLTQYVNSSWKDKTAHGKFLAVTEVVLLSLIVTLTLCTAGTWRTIAQKTPALFSWMSKMPSVIMGVINPLVTSLSTLAFNIQNTSETLEMIDKANRYLIRSLPKLPSPQPNGTYDSTWRNQYVFEESLQRLIYIKEDGIAELVPIINMETFKQSLRLLSGNKKTVRLTPDEVHEHITLNGGHVPKGNVFTRFIQSFKDSYAEWNAIKNPWHKWNPFRLFINFTYTPLHRSLFIGHLSSSSVLADQVPNVPEVASAFLGFVCDGAVDAHYFAPQQNEQHDHSLDALLEERLKKGGDHNHEDDIPTRLLKFTFFPIHLLAEGWDWLSTAPNERAAFNISTIWAALIATWTTWMYGASPSLQDHSHETLPERFIPSKNAWPIERAIYRIERYKEKYLQGAVVSPATAEEKIAHLSTLQQELRRSKLTPKVLQTIRETVNQHIDHSEHAQIYNKHRFFNYGKTGTATFLEEDLLRRVAPRAC